MENKVYKVDCHCHPLDHIHYPIPAWKAVLSSLDKENIMDMLRTQSDRGMDAVCITDHNQHSSGIYARKIAKDLGLPIKVIPGAECSIIIDGEELHVLALGCKEPFVFEQHQDLDILVDLIHEAEGLAVLAHPHYYPHIVPYIHEYFDGLEEYNGVNAANNPSREFFDTKYIDFKGFLTQGSDYHLRTPFMRMYLSQEMAATIVSSVDTSIKPLYNIVSEA